MEAPSMKKVELTPDQIKELTRWADYLRTSGLQQGSGRLRTGDEYCCLGVYCEMVDPDGWEAESYKQFAMSHRGMETELPLEYEQALGIVHIGEAFAAMNDDLSYTFEKIADEIMYFIRTGLLTGETEEALLGVYSQVFHAQYTREELGDN